MQLRRFLISSLLVWGIALQGLFAMADEWVTLQNNEGQSIRVKLLSLQGHFVHIQMQGGRSMKTSLSVYNEASQARIRQHFISDCLCQKILNVSYLKCVFRVKISDSILKDPLK